MNHTSPPLPSATVMLLDPERGEGEPFGLYLLQRRSRSRFMPGRFVFPGGRVEPGDGADPRSPGSLATCALRELWEEAGVVLARDPEAAAAIAPPRREQARRRLQRGDWGLEQALQSLDLAPDPRALIPYARWITPSARPQRFDTVFFLALMPPGQEAQSDHLETSRGLWLGPARALEENLAGRVELAPPQVRILGELSRFSSLEELLTGAPKRSLEPVRPFLWIQGKQRVILLPWDPDYARRRPQGPARPCPAGLASRLVHQQGRWLPARPEASL